MKILKFVGLVAVVFLLSVALIILSSMGIISTRIAMVAVGVLLLGASAFWLVSLFKNGIEAAKKVNAEIDKQKSPHAKRSVAIVAGLLVMFATQTVFQGLVSTMNGLYIGVAAGIIAGVLYYKLKK
jgi:hypothetical protein